MWHYGLLWGGALVVCWVDTTEPVQVTWWSYVVLARYRMWLDDERPSPSSDWQACTSVAAAQDMVRRYGWPCFLSTDHDLGNGPTGLDFAKWLIERDLDLHDMPPDFGFAVHSANPVGAENIRALFTNYLKKGRLT